MTTLHITWHWLPALLFFVTTCAPEHPEERGAIPATERPAAMQTPAQAGAAPYDFEHPDVALALHDDLKEVSGLTLLEGGQLWAVQDETGILFLLNPETGAIEARHAFGDGGDYEGIEGAGDALFVLLSNGTLIQMTDWTEEAPQTRTHKTSLKGKNDTEGLGYDAARGRLLIACKEEPGGDLDKDQKAIYAFDVAAGTLSRDPVLVIDRDEVERRIPDAGAFKPSALAVHPVTGEVYVLSATAGALAVLGADGGLRHVWELPGSLFEQPEGLAFQPDGTLFIASEGVDGPAMLYRFTYSEQG